MSQVPASEQHSYRHLYKHCRLTQCKIFLGILIYCTIYVRGLRERCARTEQSTDVNVHRKENESVPIIASGCSVNLQSKSSNNWSKCTNAIKSEKQFRTFALQRAPPTVMTKNTDWTKTWSPTWLGACTLGLIYVSQDKNNPLNLHFHFLAIFMVFVNLNFQINYICGNGWFIRSPVELLNWFFTTNWNWDLIFLFSVFRSRRIIGKIPGIE